MIGLIAVSLLRYLAGDEAMNGILASAKTFSTVNEVLDERFFSEVVLEYALSLMSLLAERYSDSVLPEGADLSTMLAASVVSTDPYWCPELGHCMAALKNDNLAAAQRATVQISTNLSAAGIPGEWAASFVRPTRLRWDRFILPEAIRLEVDSDGTEAVVDVRSAGSTGLFRFSATKGKRIEWHSGDLDPLPVVDMGDHRILLLSGPDSKQLDLPDPVLPGVTVITETETAHIRDCIDFFRQNLPTWIKWFDRTIRLISIAKRAPAGIHSGSTEGYYSLMSISDCDDVFRVGESLIHEASHNYFFLLACVSELVKETGKLYYSPFAKRDRPAFRILLAYHAFTNVEIFYRACLRLGFEADRCKIVLAQLRRELGPVEHLLSTDIEFTPVGRQMYDALLASRSDNGAIN